MRLPFPFCAMLSPMLLAIGLLLPGAALGAAESPVAPAAPLTVGRAVQIALRQNPALQQAGNQVASGVIDLAQRRADFAPDLRLTLAGSERFDKEIDPLSGDRDGRNVEAASGALDSTVNLFHGFGDVAALHSAEWTLAGLRDSLSREEQSLVFTTIARFLDALTNRELIGVRRETLEGNRRQLEQVEALYLAGNRPVSDLYQQQAETASAELDLLLAERDFAVAKLQLLQTIGIPPTTAVELAAGDPAPLESALLAVTAEALPAEALALRPDLTAQQKQIAAAREQVVQAQAGYWPTLDLSAGLDSGYSSREANGFGTQFFDDNPGAAIGLTLAVPLFDRFLTRHNVAQARIRQDDAQLTLTRLALQAGAEYGQAVEDFQTAQKLIGVTAARLIAAREALAAMEERYRVGAATLVELTQARSQFAEAGFERVRARFGLIRQRLTVAYSRGDWGELRTLLTQLENPS